LRLAHLLTLKQLRLVVAVAEHGSVLRAAAALNMSQPAATKMLKDAEARLGASLLVRHNRGVTLTDHGDVISRHGRIMLAQLQRAGEEIDDLTTGAGGRVVVGTLLAASAFILPQAIQRLRQDRPRVSVVIVDGPYERLAAGLRAGDIDFVVARLPSADLGDDLAHDPLYEERVCVVVRAGHPLARRRRIERRILEQGDWILPTVETTIRRQIDDAFRSLGCAMPRPAVESVSILTNRALLLSTDMIGIMPEQVVHDDLATGVLVRLPVSLLPLASPIGVSRRRGAMLSPAAQALLSEIKNAAQHARITGEAAPRSP